MQKYQNSVTDTGLRRIIYVKVFIYRNTSCINTLLTGISIVGIRPTGHLCGYFSGGKAIHQKGIKARFVRLDFLCKFSVTEIEVYGKLGICHKIIKINLYGFI